jgi:hypothetical protein
MQKFSREKFSVLPVLDLKFFSYADFRQQEILLWYRRCAQFELNWTSELSDIEKYDLKK